MPKLKSDKPIEREVADTGPAEPLARGDREMRGKRAYVSTQDVLNAYGKRGDITVDQWAAGDRYRAFYAVAFQNTTVLGKLTNEHGGGGMDIDKPQALDFYLKAMKAMEPAQRQVIQYVVLENIRLSRVKILTHDYKAREHLLDGLDKIAATFKKIHMA